MGEATKTHTEQARGLLAPSAKSIRDSTDQWLLWMVSKTDPRLVSSGGGIASFPLGWGCPGLWDQCTGWTFESLPATPSRGLAALVLPSGSGCGRERSHCPEPPWPFLPSETPCGAELCLEPHADFGVGGMNPGRQPLGCGGLLAAERTEAQPQRIRLASRPAICGDRRHQYAELFNLRLKNADRNEKQRKLEF